MTENRIACFFTGHRTLPMNKIKKVVCNLDCEIERLIAKGVTSFISGGALGFDQIAASLIAAKKEMGKNIRLIFVLPCKNQDALWSEKQKTLYRGLLYEADEIVYVSEQYDSYCLKKRNYYMVENSAHCICALAREKAGQARPSAMPVKKACRLLTY